MSIKVKISSAHQYFTNGKEVVEVDGTTIAQCLRDLIRQYPSLEKLMYNNTNLISDDLLVFLNGEIIPHDNLFQPVGNHDEISLVMVIGGG